MKVSHLFAATLAVVMLGSFAGAGETAKDRHIAVTGQAQISVAPTLATIVLGVSEEAEEAGLAMRATSTKMVDVVDALRDAGIAAEDMQTQQISLNPVWTRDPRYDDGRSRITGFAASNTLSVRVRDLDRLGEILDQVLMVGANEFRGLNFGVSNPAAVQDQIRAAAVLDARRKAQQLADAAGVALGPVRVINDRDVGRGRPAFAMEMARDVSVPIEAGELTFEHSVSVVFDIGAETGD
ncbi:SIMPL domain-containing protein [Phaeobacter sp.]|uniref:SIMPL domain-containing protein n=1 Tax=Phaeobacter sp. TaxID=1902409 RepID=UPI0025F42E25|nr:SIMPL domain-containing protein [Phaeobacter sp.]